MKRVAGIVSIWVKVRLKPCWIKVLDISQHALYYDESPVLIQIIDPAECMLLYWDMHFRICIPG